MGRSVNRPWMKPGAAKPGPRRRTWLLALAGLALAAGPRAALAAPPEHGLGLAADAPAGVTVLGEVGRPGPVTLQPGLRLKDALAAGGGLTSAADLHHIVVRRQGEDRLAEVDGEKAMAGDPLADAPLQAGDTVIVPRSGASLYYAVFGEVSRPVIDLYQGPQTVKTAVDGVLTRDSDKGQIVVVQGLLTDPTTARTVTVKYDDAAGAPLGPGDVVLVARRGGGGGGGGVPSWIKKALSIVVTRFFAARGTPPLTAPAPNALEKVAVVGEVFNPRLYFYGPGMTVRDALEEAAGVTPRADAANVVLSRAQGGPPVTLDAAKALAGDPAQNPALGPGDTLYVPRRAQSDVYAVLGAVRRPSVAAAGAGASLRAALDDAGMDDADRDHVVLVHGLLTDPATARAETVSYDQAGGLTLAAGDVALAAHSGAAWPDQITQVIGRLKQKVAQYLTVLNGTPLPFGAARPR